jgi:hypothetical protein
LPSATATTIQPANLRPFDLDFKHVYLGKTMSIAALRNYASASLTLTILCCSPLRAEDTARPGADRMVAQRSAAALDVALDADGALRGTVVDGSGNPLALQTVQLFQDQQMLNRVVTNANGRFALPSMRGGVYTLSCGNHVGLYRLWAPNTAPPRAESALVLFGSQVVRGQSCTPDAPCGAAGCGTCGGRHAKPGHFIGGFSLPSIHPVQFLKNPWTIGAAIGAAVAIPIALHDDEAAS